MRCSKSHRATSTRGASCDDWKTGTARSGLAARSCENFSLDYRDRRCSPSRCGLLIRTQQLYLLLDKVLCGGKQIHDANIVATMIAFDVPQLVTYNVADFQRFAGLISVVSEV